MNAPVFSIITVVYNGEKLLPGTMESVAMQSYPGIEYLVIDGGSKDGTVALVEEMQKKMPNLRWISERDKGLYDAMNKGLHLATGDFVWFLNAGDHLRAPDTVTRLAALVNAQTAVVYGETMLVDDNRKEIGTSSELSTRKLPQQLAWTDYLWGMRVVHQSFVARRTLAPDYIDGNLCADFDWCIKILQESDEIINADMILTNYLMGGVSKQRKRQSWVDRFNVMRHHFGLVPTLLAHAWIVIRAGLHWLKRLGKASY